MPRWTARLVARVSKLGASDDLRGSGSELGHRKSQDRSAARMDRGTFPREPQEPYARQHAREVADRQGERRRAPCVAQGMRRYGHRASLRNVRSGWREAARQQPSDDPHGKQDGRGDAGLTPREPPTPRLVPLAQATRRFTRRHGERRQEIEEPADGSARCTGDHLNALVRRPGAGGGGRAPTTTLPKNQAFTARNTKKAGKLASALPISRRGVAPTTTGTRIAGASMM